MSIKAGLSTIAAAALVVGLSGCTASATASGPQTARTGPHLSSSSETAPSSSPGAGHAVLITISNFMYSVPAPVARGATVTVKNQDSQNHTLTSTMHGAFDVTVGADGGTATFTAPTNPGRYPFGCTFHANMMGTLVVK
jgi:plastocyanin